MASEKLWDAISRNNLKEIHQILSTGDINLNTPYARYISSRYDSYTVQGTFLQQACVSGSPVVVCALVKAGANVNTCSTYIYKGQNYEYSATALILAVMEKKVDLVKKLLHRCGADVNATNNAGLAPLHYVVKNAYYALDEKHRGGPFKVTESTEVQEEIGHLLLAAGAAVDLQDKKGRTALHIAANWKDSVLVKILLEHHAGVDIQDSEGMTPLHIATNIKDVKLVLPGYHQKLDETLVKLLIEKGANLEATNKDHLTPLHLAVDGSLLNIVKLLVEAGADIRAETPNTGLTPLDTAEHGGNQDIIDYLTTQEKSQRERNKREEASVEQEEEEEKSQSDTAVEWIELLEEGAVGGFEKVLVIEQEEEEDSDESL